eukprot:683202-Pyramimonas_sp.AAC.1
MEDLSYGSFRFLKAGMGKVKEGTEESLSSLIQGTRFCALETDRMVTHLLNPAADLTKAEDEIGRMIACALNGAFLTDVAPAILTRMAYYWSKLAVDRYG